MNKWQNPLLTLGERCVAFAENELNNGVQEDNPGSYTSSRIREYFNVCTRKINGKEVNLHFTKGNWCAASASFCMLNSLLPGEEKPHECRLGVVEIVSDLEGKGLWRPIRDILSQSYTIKVGDIVVFYRSQPGKPETSWWRHVGRVYEASQQFYYTGSEFKCISGNSGGKWKISTHKTDQKNLLGFGQYPGVNDDTVGKITSPVDWSHINLDDLAPMHDTGSDLSSDDFYDLYKRHFRK